MALTKGNYLAHLRAFVTQRFGDGAWEELLSTLSEEDRAVVRSAVTSGWYDLALQERILRALCRLFPQPRLAEQLGRFGAERDLTTIHRWFLRLFKPSFAVRNMNLYWRRTKDTGRWVSEVRGTEVVAWLYEWEHEEPALCHQVQGYLARTLELLGCPDVEIEHPRCRTAGHPFCEFRTVHFACDAPSRASRGDVTPTDVHHIATELTQITDLDAAVDAVLEILRGRLGFEHVSLWMHAEPGGGELRLLRSVGTRGPGPLRCFVLHAADAVVGRIEVEIPRNWHDTGVIEPLLPYFAIALHGAHAARSRNGPPTADGVRSAAERANAVALAAKRWGLTPRQAEALELVVEGLTNKEIAAELGCQEGTVEVHVSQILKKSGAPNRAGLVGRVWAVSA